jgi:hypothetical protein
MGQQTSNGNPEFPPEYAKTLFSVLSVSSVVRSVSVSRRAVTQVPESFVFDEEFLRFP